MKEAKSKPKQLSNLAEVNNILLSTSEKQKISSLLEDQIQYLLDKKQREKVKKKRIKNMQEQFQKKRFLNLKKIQDKVNHSEQVKNKTLKQKVQRNKKNLQHFQKVKQKAIHQNEQEIQKHLQKRKQFQSQELQQTTERSIANNRRSVSHNNSLTLSIREKTSEQMNRIDRKITRAQTNNKFYKEQVIQKIKQRQSYFQKIQGKMKQMSLIQQQQHYKQYYKKVEQILTAQEKIKFQKDKFVKDKKKNFSDKLQKLHQNLKYLQSEKNQKFEELQQKIYKEPINMNYINNQSKASNSHRQRVLLNHKRLEQEKNKKAEQILQRHLQITLKNRAYKEGKDKIHQVINKKHPQQQELH